jgi:hypothetical protein
MPKLIDLSRQRFGRLVVSERSPRRGNDAYWAALCDCGRVTTVSSKCLRNGDTRSCGCFQREDLARRFTIHGRYKTREYAAWANARDRCVNSNDPSFKNYGGRGITMSDEWRDSFSAFYRDMGPRPDGLTLDRINNDGPYAHGNCRWATWHEQHVNKRQRAPTKPSLPQASGRAEQAPAATPLYP